MKKVYLLSFILLSCDQEETIDKCADTSVLNEPACETFIEVTAPCIIEEVEEIINDSQFTKYVYFYDGSNYNKIETYLEDNQTKEYPEVPNEKAAFTYEQGRVKKIQILRSAYPSTLINYSFEYSEATVKSTFELIENGVVTFKSSYDQLNITNPKDSIYISEGFIDILREYKNGNSIRFAVEADSGKCIINGQRWVFGDKISFDSNPNVFKEFIVRYALGGYNGYATQFWFGNNRNNMSAYINSRSNNVARYCYKFLRNGSQMWVKELEFPPSDQRYRYVYKYSCE